jgi:hypothetical protein
MRARMALVKWITLKKSLIFMGLNFPPLSFNAKGAVYVTSKSLNLSNLQICVRWQNEGWHAQADVHQEGIERLLDRTDPTHHGCEWTLRGTSLFCRSDL